MTKLLSSALVLLLTCGCGGDSFSAGQGGTGNVGDAGKSSGAGPGESGAASGGSSSHGATSAGGNATAGKSASGGDGGGKPGGGSATGGGNNGGVTTGGASGGESGGTSMSGSSTGGASSTTFCQVDQDCVSCAYEKMPTTVLDCYCVGCADTPMNVSSCEQNQERWEKVCSAVDLACDPVKCLPPEPVRCEKGRCVDAQ